MVLCNDNDKFHLLLCKFFGNDKTPFMNAS